MDGTTALRTVTLTERAAGECRLSRADVDFLLAGHRAHVEVVPTGRAGRYRLTPTGHVGTILTPTCRLVIRPKVPVEDLFYLLDPAAPVEAVFQDRSAVTPGAEAFDFLAGRLAALLAERAAAGLHRAYVERADHGPFLQGRLDVPAHLREPGGRKDRLHCRYEDFTADVPCNQVPKATAELVLQSSLLREEVRAALRGALGGFAGVRPAPLNPDSFAAAEPDPLTEAYRPLLDLCRLLADALTPRPGEGPVPCPAFLLDMERVFERHVTAGVVRAFPPAGPWHVAVQPSYSVCPPAPGRPGLQVRPDLVIERSGQRRVVVDAKWKGLAGAPVVTADLYQVLAYGTLLGVRRAVLVYPGRRHRIRTFPLAGGTFAVQVCRLRVQGPRTACERSLQRLGRLLRHKDQ